MELTRFHFLSTPETQLDDSLTRYFLYGCSWCSSQLKSSDSECMRTETANSRSQWQWSSKWKEYNIPNRPYNEAKKNLTCVRSVDLTWFFCVFFDCAIPAQSLARLWNSRDQCGASLQGSTRREGWFSHSDHFQWLPILPVHFLAVNIRSIAAMGPMISNVSSASCCVCSLWIPFFAKNMASAFHSWRFMYIITFSANNMEFAIRSRLQ